MALGVQHIIICGHSDCGAMKAVLNPAELRRMPTVKAWLLHSEVAKTVVERNCGCADHNTLGILTKENVVAQLDHLRTHPSVAARLAAGQLFIHGWVYDIETSEILAYDADRGEFRPIGDGPVPMATPKPRYHPDQDCRPALSRPARRTDPGRTSVPPAPDRALRRAERTACRARLRGSCRPPRPAR